LLRLLPFLIGGHRQLALENLALRQQLAVYKRRLARSRLRTTDRLLTVLREFFGTDRLTLTASNPDATVTRTLTSFSEIVKSVEDARVGPELISAAPTSIAPRWAGGWRSTRGDTA
jgi:hypothetical protein